MNLNFSSYSTAAAAAAAAATALSSFAINGVIKQI